jgi:hypothetical protein
MSGTEQEINGLAAWPFAELNVTNCCLASAEHVKAPSHELREVDASPMEKEEENP